MDRGHSKKYLTNIVPAFFFRKACLGAGDQISKGSASTVLHDHPEGLCLGLDEGVKVADYVVTVNAGQNVAFADCGLYLLLRGSSQTYFLKDINPAIELSLAFVYHSI
eukprot:XP_001708968.1 Hypothetical protein GL50803_39394 [Giardia lamblia ATCC 50803]